MRQGNIEFVPKFTSTITQRLRTLQNQSLSFAIERQLPLVELTGGSVVRHNLDVDKAFRQGLIADGVDADLLFSEEESAAFKKQEQDALQAQQTAETAKTATEATKNLPDEQQQELFEVLG